MTSASEIFLLASPTTRASEPMDHRFIALKAVDDQETAIAVYQTDLILLT